MVGKYNCKELHFFSEPVSKILNLKYTAMLVNTYQFSKQLFLRFVINSEFLVVEKGLSYYYFHFVLLCDVLCGTLWFNELELTTNAH